MFILRRRPRAGPVEAFLVALQADIIGKRGAQDVPDARGSTAAVTAYLAGRPCPGVTTPDGGLPGPLPPWPQARQVPPGKEAGRALPARGGARPGRRRVWR